MSNHLFDKAQCKIDKYPQLQVYREVLMTYDGSDFDNHLEWIVQAPVNELLDWAKKEEKSPRWQAMINRYPDREGESISAKDIIAMTMNDIKSAPNARAAFSAFERGKTMLYENADGERIITEVVHAAIARNDGKKVTISNPLSKSWDEVCDTMCDIMEIQ